MKRKLASIQKIEKIEPIENADRIEVASILGWKIVVKKGEFKQGDICVYFEVDSFLPICPEFEFLRNSSFKKSDILGEGFRIKTQKLRGVISQGLILPLSILPEGNYKIDDDVSEILGVKKWIVPEIEGNLGTIINGFCPYTSKTDEIRIQTIPDIIQELKGKPYYISTKMDGTSVTMWSKDGEFHVCGRDSEYKDDEKAVYWNVARKLNIVDKIKESGLNIAIQGEMCGPKIQKNRLKLTELHWYVFTIVDLNTGKRYNLDKLIEFCNIYGLEHVPIEEQNESFEYTTIEELLERAKGQYPSGLAKEGIVIRSLTNDWSKILNGPLSFKVLNNNFLLKE